VKLAIDPTCYDILLVAAGGSPSFPGASTELLVTLLTAITCSACPPPRSKCGDHLTQGRNWITIRLALVINPVKIFEVRALLQTSGRRLMLFND
jgi:hypothetical protein